MKYRSLHFAVIGSIAVLASAQGWGSEPPILHSDSEISSVTVYGDRAEVTRTLTVEISKGGRTVEVGDLPASLDDRTATVSGEGSALATITGLRVERVPHVEPPKEELRALEEQIEEIDRRIQSQDDAIGIASHKIDFLQSLQTQYAKRQSDLMLEEANARSAAEMLKFTAAEMAEAYAVMRQAEQEKEELAEKRRVLNQEHRKKSSPHAKDTKVAKIEMNVEKAGTLNLSLNYVLAGASWSPLYNVRVFPDTKKVQIDYSANVRQQTGEDWDDVALALSTAEPARGGRLPKATPFVVGVQRIYTEHKKDVVMRQRAVMEDSVELAEGEAVGIPDAAPEPASGLVSRGVSTPAGAAAVLFEIPVKQSIASGDEPVKVGVTSLTLGAELEYFTVPKDEPYVFLKGKLKNTSEFPLLAGRAFIFVDNSLVATTGLATVTPGEKFEISFGVYPSLSVERERIKHGTTSTNKRKRETFEYKIKVENHRKETTTVKVQEAFPISEHGDIVVKMGDVEPPTTKETEQGIATWEIELVPGEEKEITFDYTVDYPSKSRLIL